MIATLRGEFRKLLTVRSTYILAFISLALIVLFALYFQGYKGGSSSSPAPVFPNALTEITSNVMGLIIIFPSITIILFMAHEYRYNTIMYTLTSNARRTRVLLAKIIATITFSALYGLFAVLITLGSYLLGLELRGATLPPQDFDMWAQIGKGIFYFVGYGLVGLLIAIWSRSVVTGIAALLIIPLTLEPLLGFIIKDIAKYLPFGALDSVLGVSAIPGALSSGSAALLVSGYLIFSMTGTWYLFLRRDAN